MSDESSGILILADGIYMRLTSATTVDLVYSYTVTNIAVS